jgi:Dynamin family
MSEGTDFMGAARTAREAYEHASGLGDAPLLARAPREPQRPARIVVIGEFNSGKTSLINAFLGTSVLPTSFITRTACPTVIGYAAKPSLAAEIARRKRMRMVWERIGDPQEPDIRRLHVGVPLQRLKTLRVIDTPGLGLDDDHSDARTLRACRGADTVIWCTPAMQAWKASEERAWLTLPKRLRQRGILAVTFADAIASQDAHRLLARLHAEAGPHFREVVLASELRDWAPAPRQTPMDLGLGLSRSLPTACIAASLATAELQ